MVIDTDVLIWYMKGNEKAFKTIENSKSFFISVVTYMELVQGMRNKKELTKLRKALLDWNSKILYISEQISVKGHPSKRGKSSLHFWNNNQRPGGHSPPYKKPQRH